MVIREAQLSDAKAIANVHVSSWKSAYQHLIEQQDMQNLTLENRITLWETVLKKKINGQMVFVAEVEDHIVGFISGGKERTKNYGFDAEIYAIYLLEDYQGKGIGSGLFSAFVYNMAHEGYTSLLVWVLTQNPYKRFYEKYGAAPIEAEKVTIGKGTYEETAYGWKNMDKLLETINYSKAN
ncbi:GNAT family N-acetyltransferase [Pontibacillus salicampi]|uniref:GNAT family N-acetyltransferase n=1 Tax=Pontibacillus salicampi TaxID=1449801 RepID=A0ABV6LM25_9BACI